MDEKPADLENYYIKEKIGQGVYSTVYRAAHKLTDEQVAVKIYDKDTLRNTHRKEMLDSEVHGVCIYKFYSQTISFLMLHID
jgi:serine/threonine protein kinase